MLFHFANQLIGAVRIALVFLIDQLLQANADRVPGNVHYVVTASTSNKELSQRQSTPPCLNPFVIDRTADRCNMNANLVSNLLHLQRFNMLGTLFQKFALIIDNSLSDF